MDELLCWKLVALALAINNLVMCAITDDKNITPLACGANFVISFLLLAGVL
jgi:hypothetical protein